MCIKPVQYHIVYLPIYMIQQVQAVLHPILLNMTPKVRAAPSPTKYPEQIRAVRHPFRVAFNGPNDPKNLSHPNSSLPIFPKVQAIQHPIVILSDNDPKVRSS